MIRMLDGMKLRIIEKKNDEQAVTAVNAIDITTLTSSDEVTASAEQMPRICRAMGLFWMSKIFLRRVSSAIFI